MENTTVQDWKDVPRELVRGRPISFTMDLYQPLELEQNRIHQNMAQLDRTNELYAKDVKKFAEQEDRVESLRKEITALIQQEQEARKGLDDFW